MRHPNWFEFSSTTAVLGAVMVACSQTIVSAQTAAKPKPRAGSPTEIKRLDAKVDDLRESFFRETTTLIKGYEDAGLPERAKVLLEALGRLDPTNDAIKQKLTELKKTILDSREYEIDIDPAKSWQPVGSVVKDEMLRIRARGDYSGSIALTAGPDGVPAVNPAEDVAGHVPLGAVMAVIASGAPEKDGKPPRPFAVGKQYEKPAERTGMLFLKVNLPSKRECKGKLTVQISGATRLN